jgi:hypothetical protein
MPSCHTSRQTQLIRLANQDPHFVQELRPPSINDAQVIVVETRPFRQFVHTGLQAVPLTLVLLHLSVYGILLESLVAREEHS